MQHNVAFASDAKQRLLSTLEMLKDFIPGGQIDESSAGQIVSILLRQSKVIWVVFQNLVAMGRASV